MTAKNKLNMLISVMDICIVEIKFPQKYKLVNIPQGQTISHREIHNCTKTFRSLAE